MNLTALTIDDLYNEVADTAREQGVSNKHMWHELSHDIVEDHLALGELDVDEDSETMKEALDSMWEEYKLENGVGEEKDASNEEDEI